MFYADKPADYECPVTFAINAFAFKSFLTKAFAPVENIHQNETNERDLIMNNHSRDLIREARETFWTVLFSYKVSK